MRFEDPVIKLKKAELRMELRLKRKKLTDDERRAAALAAAERAASLPQLTGASLVLAYMPMKYELDILPTVDMLKGKGVRIAFPLCTEGHGLRLFIPAEENGFVPGAYGIMEPNTVTSQEVFPEELSAILLPAVGFDKNCCRLGQGGGYYDRLLLKAGCFKAAAGFDCQLVDKVPVDVFDAKVDAVITPSCTLVR